MVNPAMNDKFSSVQLPPGLRVTICEHANFGGRCIPVGGDRDIRTCVAPRLPLGGVVQHDANLLLLPEQRLSDDLACIP